MLNRELDSKFGPKSFKRIQGIRAASQAYQQSMVDDKKASKMKPLEVMSQPVLPKLSEIEIVKSYLQRFPSVKDDVPSLTLFLKEAEVELNAPLGQVYEKLVHEKDNNIDTNIITTSLFDACRDDQTEIITLLAQSGFSLDKTVNQQDHWAAKSLLNGYVNLVDYAMKKEKYDLLNILVELGADLNHKFVGEINYLLYFHYSYKSVFLLAAIGVKEDLRASDRRYEAYHAGKNYQQRYKEELLVFLVLNIKVDALIDIIIDYLGKHMLSIPPGERPKCNTKPIKVSRASFFSGKIDEKERKVVEKSNEEIAEKFDSWMKRYNHYNSDSQELIDWLFMDSGAKYIKNYAHFCQLAKFLHEKLGYECLPVASEDIFNSALHEYTSRSCYFDTRYRL